MQYHRIARIFIAFAAGILLAWYAFEKFTDPQPALKRAREEAVVLEARQILASRIAAETPLQIVDPLATNRRVGKAYIYPTQSGWEVSGHYRRGETDRWHPYLMSLDAKLGLVSLQVRDDDEKLLAAAAEDPALTVSGYPRSGDDPEDHRDN